MSGYDAVVVGSGPNGLAAAITLLKAGKTVCLLEGSESAGGSVRSAELTLPGFLHDTCSAVLPFATASPFFRRLPLADHGLEWVHAPVPLAHPFDDGTAAVLEKDYASMLRRYPRDAGRYERLFGTLVREWDRLAWEILQPVTHLPRHPLLMGKFGISAMQPAARLAQGFADPHLGALFAGTASHAMVPLGKWLTASFGMVLLASGHVGGWPFVKGGSQAMSDALVSYFKSLGGELELGREVRSMNDLPPHRAVLFDVAPANLLKICSEQLSGRYRRQLLGYKRGQGVFKVDYALSEPVPWKAPECRQAGTLHLGGAWQEIEEAEHEVGAGRAPERPLVLVAQPSLFDDRRAPPGQHTLWAYSHLPFRTPMDYSSAIENQIERFAPGFRDTVLARSTMGPPELEARNPNLVGGDITGGSNGGLQLFFRPRVSLHPYDTPAEGVYICSASTPPGGGVHGMCGYWAARRALRRELR